MGYYMALPDVLARAIEVNDLAISAIVFDLSKAQRERLYESGRSGARDFLATWDFETYKARFRSGQFDTKRHPELAQPQSMPLRAGIGG